MKRKELYLSGSWTFNAQADIIGKTDKLHDSSIAAACHPTLAMPGTEHIEKGLALGLILEMEAIWSRLKQDLRSNKTPALLSHFLSASPVASGELEVYRSEILSLTQHEKDMA